MSRDTYIHHAEGAGPDRPLIFVFHGTGGSEAQFVPLARRLFPGAAIVAPRGDVSEAGAARFFRRRAEGVYDMEDLVARTAAMTDFVEAHVAAARPTRVLGLGYSNGANILASSVFARPSLFERVALLHPLIPWTPDPVPVATRVLITAGRHDPICPPGATQALADWFTGQGAAVTLDWHDGGHGIEGSELLALERFFA